MGEFDLIERYFTWDNAPDSIAIGVGDDAAILNVPKNHQIVTSIDTLISGVHFPENTPADAIAHKALAVNLSDLAAMGAKPAWFTLALTLPAVDSEWLGGFSKSLKSIASQYGIYLVGGDTTRGPLSISIQVTGLVETDKALLRSGAKVGDSLYVTGTLGDAAAGLQSLTGGLKLNETDQSFCVHKLNYPQPRLSESTVFRKFASSCIDVSDGLLQDLSHVLKASSAKGECVGAELDLSALPLSSALKKLDRDQARQFALSGGDDYELLFTVPQKKEANFLKEIDKMEICKVSSIGTINNLKQQITDRSGHPLTSSGYNHFNGKFNGK